MDYFRIVNTKDGELNRSAKRPSSTAFYIENKLEPSNCKRTLYIRYFLLLSALLQFCVLTEVNAQGLPGTPATPTAPSSPIPGDESGQCDYDGPSNCALGASDVGSSPSSPLPDSGVGNPINLMNGNKFQSETDFSLPGSQFMLKRMYNSAAADSNVGVGRGWRHSFSVKIEDTGDGSRRITQSDGAIIHFSPDGTDVDGYPRMRAAQSNHGFLVQKDNRHDWHLNDGRTLSFQGSYLVEINWPDQRNLKMFYRSKQLESVTDETGRVLIFTYTPWRDSGLSTFDNGPFSNIAGHLESVTLPDGSVIRYSYDSNGNLSRTQFPDATNRKYHYENDTYTNHLTGLTNRNDIRFASWSYDEYGRAISSEHAGGVEKVTLEYPEPLTIANGEVVQTIITNSLDQQSTYSWQQATLHAQPKLLASEGPGCATCPDTGFMFTYDDAGRLVQSRKTGLGNSVGNDSILYSYDEQGRLSDIRRIDDVGIESLVERHEYNDIHDLYPIRTFKPSVNAAAEQFIETMRDPSGLVVQIKEIGFTPWTTLPGEEGYDENNAFPNQFSETTRVTKLQHDNGKLVSLDGPAEGDIDVSYFKWDSLNRIVSIQQPGLPEMVFGKFDSMGRATQVFNGSAAPFTIGYSTNGLISTIKHRAIEVEFVYDAEGKLLAFTDANGHTSTFDYDAAGRPTKTSDTFGRTRVVSYDNESRTENLSTYGINGDLIKALTMSFGENGLLQSEDEQSVNANGDLINRRSNYEHNALRQLTNLTDIDSGASVSINVDIQNRTRAITQANGDTNTDLFDRLWQDAGVIDARNNTTHHIRNDFGERVGVISPDTGVERLELNSAGLAIARVREDSGTTRYTYDGAGRVLSRSHSVDGTTTFSYDKNSGKIASVVNLHSEETFQYNQYGMLSNHTRKIDGQTFVTSYVYNERGKIASKTLPDGQSLFHHYHESGVNFGQLRAITRSSLLGLRQQPVVAEIDLEARDGATGWMAHNGVHTRIKHAATGEIQSINTVQEQSLDYVFDDFGNIVSITKNGQERRFTYNGNRLSAMETDQQVIRYEYDVLGNRVLSEAHNNNELIEKNILKYTNPGQGNRILETVNAVSGLTESFEYDSAGSPVVRGAVTTDYDAERRPTRVQRDGELIAEYAYNGFGERIKKVVYSRGKAPTITYFLYDNNSLSAKIESDENKITNYLYIQPNLVVAQLVGSEIHAIHSDHLGTPIRMSGHDGETLWSATYSPFGEASIEVAERTLNLRFPGQYYDAETGIHYNYFRDYDPALGRYLTSDPIGMAGGPNTYAYVGLNPIGFIDPLGLFLDTRTRWQRLVASARAALRTVVGVVGISDAVVVAMVVGSVGPHFVVQGSIAPAITQGTISLSYNALIEEIKLYDPNLGNSHSPIGWTPNRQNVQDLLAQLTRLQQEYIASGQCNVNFNQGFYDRAIAAQRLRGLITPVSSIFISPEGEQFVSETEYQTDRLNFDLLGGERGTGMTFSEWLLQGKPGYGTSPTGATTGQYVVHRHGANSPRPVGFQSHHGVMSEWMRQNCTGYRESQAPAVLMPTQRHYDTFGVFNRWKAAWERANGEPLDWTKITLAEKRRLSNAMFRAAGVPRNVVAKYWREFARYMTSIGC